MARILGGGLFGEMRGKLGSVVFARNRGGAYSRSYAKPVDPRTIAQLTARNNFGSASSNYHALTPDIKALWQNFANSVFNPKTGTTGVPSGFNAFVSLLNVVNNTKIFSDSEFTGLVGDPNPMEFGGTPPTNALQANFGNSSGGANPYNFGNFGALQYTEGESTILLAGSFSINVTGGGIGPSGNFEGFTDSVGNDFGFTVFMSNPVAQPGMFVQNPYLIQLGTALGISLETPAPIGTTINATFASQLTSGNYSAFPQLGQYVQLSLFAVSTTGMLLRIGSEFVELTASL